MPADIHGILLLDKAFGRELSRCGGPRQNAFSAPGKAGHTGSLDPLASGMLPICFWRSHQVRRQLPDAEQDVSRETAPVLGQRTAERRTVNPRGDRNARVAAFVGVQQLGSGGARRFFRANYAQYADAFGESSRMASPYTSTRGPGITRERARRRAIVIREHCGCSIWQAPRPVVRRALHESAYIRVLAEDLAAQAQHGIAPFGSSLRRLGVAPFSDAPAVDF